MFHQKELNKKFDEEYVENLLNYFRHYEFDMMHSKDKEIAQINLGMEDTYESKQYTLKMAMTFTAYANLGDLHFSLMYIRAKVADKYAHFEAAMKFYTSTIEYMNNHHQKPSLQLHFSLLICYEQLLSNEKIETIKEKINDHIQKYNLDKLVTLENDSEKRKSYINFCNKYLPAEKTIVQPYAMTTFSPVNNQSPTGATTIPLTLRRRKHPPF